MKCERETWILLPSQLIYSTFRKCNALTEMVCINYYPKYHRLKTIFLLKLGKIEKHSNKEAGFDENFIEISHQLRDAITGVINSTRKVLKCEAGRGKLSPQLWGAELELNHHLARRDAMDELYFKGFKQYSSVLDKFSEEFLSLRHDFAPLNIREWSTSLNVGS